MSQRLSTSFVNTNIPGAYPSVTVKSTPLGIGSVGDVIIIGEAEGGADFSQEKLVDNSFDVTQLDRVAAKYIRGPIVDAMAALTAPSNDTEIPGSSGRVIIVKTNAGTKASAAVENSYGTISDKNFGKDGNKYYYQITQIESEVAPKAQGSNINSPYDGSLYDSLQFSIRLNGGAEADLQLDDGTGNLHDTLADLAAEIDGLLPTGVSCELSQDGNALVFVMDEDLNANEKGWGKSLEIIGDAADLLALGFSQSLISSSQEPEINVAVLRQDNNTNESFDVASEIAMTIGYAGDTATVTINATQLTTSVTGGVGANLSIDLATYPTIADLAAFISTQPGYSAQAASASISSSPQAMDKVSNIGIASSIGARPGRIKRAKNRFEQKVAQSSVVDFEIDATQGLPSEMSQPIYLSGGQKGSTSGANIIAALSALEGVKANFVVPLFSRDASADIADGLTESGSTYTIDAINFAVKSHVLQMSTVKLKRNRIALLSKEASYADVKAHAQSLASYRANLCFQKTSQVNSLGNVVEYQPWHTAVIAAGMQSAGFYKSITNKFANVISYKDPAGFDSGNPGDVEDAIDGGLLFLQKETAGNKWVVDQTTYGFDGNFVYNSLQATYLADVLAIQLAESLERFAVGKSLADIDAASIKGFIGKQMDSFKKLKITAASDDAPLGFKNLDVKINGPIAEVKMEVKLSTAILFIPIQLEISQVQSSAE
jgi:hypothetical protein